MANALIINYHRVVKDDDPSGIIDQYTVKITGFLRQIDLLTLKGIPVISLSEWMTDRFSSNIHHWYSK